MLDDPDMGKDANSGSSGSGSGSSSNGNAASSSSSSSKHDYRNSFLYKLSEQSHLGKFEKVILVASPKDQYVPFYSARLQVFTFSSLFFSHP